MRSLSLTPGGAPAPASLATGAPAPDRIAIWFDGVLDDSFVMIRDLQLPNAPTSVDMLVLGPPGVWALYVESDPGQYRAQGRDFYAWNSAAGGYVLLAPNPLEHLLLIQANVALPDTSSECLFITCRFFIIVYQTFGLFFIDTLWIFPQERLP